RPEIGRAAAEEARDEIKTQLAGSHMVFIAAGMGGGTGTGAAAIIAEAAREVGALTVAIVSKPFHFEGSRRMRVAEAGIQELRGVVDTLIVIPNQNLFRIATEKTTFAEAFVLADQVLYSGIACIVDLIMKDGLINLDFADVKAVMADMGSAVMGTGEAEGAQRAVLAAEEALANPLLDDVALDRAQGVLISIVGGGDLTLYEVDEAASRIRQEVDPDANIIVGATFDAEFGSRMRVSLVAAGMDREAYAALQAARALEGSGEPATAVTAPPSPVGEPGPAIATAAASVAAPPPPLPSPREPRTHSDRVDDFAKALGSLPIKTSDAEAAQAVTAKSGAASVTVADAATAKPSVAPAWTSSDGVRIDPEDPDIAGLDAGLPEQSAINADGAPAAITHEPQFEPAMPEEARPSRPRVPDVEEFPAVGQRAYHAYTQDRKNVASEPRQGGGGLLSRFSSLGRRGESPRKTPQTDPAEAREADETSQKITGTKA
ncbi:MAG: cell division protein FtsZ, partial [Pseudomonadota bacterium]